MNPCDITVPRTRIQHFLAELLAIPSPCGLTDAIVHYVGQCLETMGITYDLTRRGTIRAHLPGQPNSQARAIVNHLDTIGAMVRGIDDYGRIHVVPIGFWSSRFAEGCRATLFSEQGTYRGSLMPDLPYGKSRDEGISHLAMDWQTIHYRLDQPVFSADDVKQLGIEVGDFIALDSQPEFLDNGYVVARNLDNKAGAAALLATLESLTKSGELLPQDCYFIFTITETIGTGTASAILPQVSELVTVDFASLSYQERSPLKTLTLASSDASGPYDYHLTRHLRQLANQYAIPCQTKHLEAFHSDTASALAAGHDVRIAVLAYPGNASHSLERIHLQGLEHLSQLLLAYLATDPAFSKDEALTNLNQFSHQHAHVIHHQTGQ